MSIRVEVVGPAPPAQSFMLVHPARPGNYAFDVRGETTTVTRTARASRDAYTIPTEDARILWASLRGKGYERF